MSGGGRTAVADRVTALGRAAKSVRFASQDEWYATPAKALAGYHGFVSESVAGGAPWVRVLGEPLWEGRSASEVRTWCRYESLLNLAFSGFTDAGDFYIRLTNNALLGPQLLDVVVESNHRDLLPC